MQKTRKSQLCRHVSPHLFFARPRTVNPVRHGRLSRRACGARTVRETRDGWAPPLSHLAAAYSQSATTLWETWVRWGKGLLHSPRAHPAFHFFFLSPLVHTRTYANTRLPRPNMCFLFQNAARWIHCNDVVGPRRSRPSGCVSVMARRSSTTSAGMPTYGSTSSSSLSGDHGGKLDGSVRKV